MAVEAVLSRSVRKLEMWIVVVLLEGIAEEFGELVVKLILYGLGQLAMGIVDLAMSSPAFSMFVRFAAGAVAAVAAYVISQHMDTSASLAAFHKCT